MDFDRFYNRIPMLKKLKEYVQAIIIFCLAFLALTVWEGSSYHHNSHTVEQNMTKINNLHSSIDSSNLNHYKHRKLIFYSKDCPSCIKTIPKYYATDRLVDILSFHSQPIYLETNIPSNDIIADQLGINSIPQQTQIINLDYNPTVHQFNNLTQKRISIRASNMWFKLIILNIIWSAILALIYLFILDIAMYFKYKRHAKSNL